MRKLHVQQRSKLNKVNVVDLVYARTYNGVQQGWLNGLGMMSQGQLQVVQY
jgi:hypothetical protein